ncbi:TnsA endonuclease N-terminal domain-containing protein [Clostridium perfringens]
MSKRNRVVTEKVIAKKVAQNRGTGTNESYKPWDTIQENVSNGIAARHSSIKANRVVHLMTELETKYFYLLEWSTNVIDIRERFPLEDMDVAITLANARGIKYPVDPISKEPIVLNTSFMITMLVDNKEVNVARTVCYSKDLSKKKFIDKLEIQREYWAKQGVDWGIITEKDIPNVLAKNIEWLHKVLCEDTLKGYDIDGLSIDISILLNYLNENRLLDARLGVSLANLDNYYGKDNGYFLFLFKILICRRYIKLDMLQSLLVNSKISELNIEFNNSVMKGVSSL